MIIKNNGMMIAPRKYIFKGQCYVAYLYLMLVNIRIKIKKYNLTLKGEIK